MSRFLRSVFFKRIMLITTFGLSLLVLLAGGLFALSLSAKPPRNLGIRDGRLAACPDSPNCVSTQTSGQTHWMKPIPFSESPEQVMEHIASIVRSMPGGSIVVRDQHYLRAEFRSPFFHFVDDVEFQIEPESARIHFRSASRVGYHDLGANRRRMEEFRRRFAGVADPRMARLSLN